VPGQVFSPQILEFMASLDTPEVHGYRADLGYRVYVDKALEIAALACPAPTEERVPITAPLPEPPAASPAAAAVTANGDTPQENGKSEPAPAAKRARK